MPKSPRRNQKHCQGGKMWILPEQLIQSHSLQATVELSEVLSWQESESITLPLVRSKPIPKRTLSTRWKQGHWLRTLFGRMRKPSQVSSFLEKWISSQADSHANHFQQQGQETQMTTHDIYSLPVCEQLNLLDQLGYSWRTSKDSSRPSSAEKVGRTPREHPYSFMCLENWKDEVIKQRGEYSQRVKQAHHIKGNGSLSWPTPRTCTAMAASINPKTFNESKPKSYTWKRKWEGNTLAQQGEDLNNLNGSPQELLLNPNGGPGTPSRVDHRVDRLRMLGNGVVPHTARIAWIELNKRLQND